ncbi:MAG TPA: DNRLRE domain-containing protein [Actinomycetota bacterium]|nr:DNRLRE domain-containing protein [Actinomycetota bacterium]
MKRFIRPALFATTLAFAGVTAAFAAGLFVTPEKMLVQSAGVSIAPPPSTGINFPAATAYNTAGFDAGCSTGGGDICGTASFNGSDASVKLSIRRPGGSYWDGSSFGSTSEVMLDGSGTTSWSYAIAGSSLVPDGTYTIRVVASDSIGSTSVARTFSIETVAPAATTTFPTATIYGSSSWAAGCPTVGFCGTASDASGVAKVEVSIQQGSGSYWNGSGFASPTPVALTPIGLTSWSYAFSFSSFPTDGAYTVRVIATDGVGNASPVASTTFTIDSTAPSVTIAFPGADGAVFNTQTKWESGLTGAAGDAAGCGTSTTGDICGTTSDALSGVAQVQWTLQRASDSTFWNGSSWVAPSASNSASVSSGRWNASLPWTALSANGSYTLTTTTSDAASNSASASRVFTIDTVGPAASATFPAADNDAYNTATVWNQGLSGATGDAAGCGTSTAGDICGTVSDATSTVSSVTWTLRRASDGRYWSAAGNAWGTAVVNNAATMTASKWNAAVASTVVSAVQTTYTLTVTGTDAPGNIASTTRTFRYDATAPTVAMSFPAANSTHTYSTWATGCTIEGFCGTASDALSGVARVEISLRQGTTAGNYWNGSSFSSTAEVFNVGSGTTSWGYAFPFANFPANTTYRVRFRSVDVAGNTSAIGTRDFTIDRTRTCTLTASADTYVDEATPATNYGLLDSLFVRSEKAGKNPVNKRSLVQFDLTGCSPAISSSSTVNSASLNMYMTTAPTQARTYGVHRVTAAWSETAVAWADQPAFNATATGTVSTATAGGVTLSWTVTADLQAFSAGTASNHGWSVVDSAESNAQAREATFSSREHATASQRPTLTITYVP